MNLRDEHISKKKGDDKESKKGALVSFPFQLQDWGNGSDQEMESVRKGQQEKKTWGWERG